ncbi:hypothetical protein AH782_25275 [Salmonella enterica subsp. enterica]|nr:hypothetical protein [Salmonella enterica subsp. enterica serovar Rubislaw]EDK1589370.1 hypothetical protein [Salmonella enterica subsp. enterica serovar Rubislaw]
MPPQLQAGAIMNILPTSASEFPLSGNVRIRQVAQFLAMTESTVHRRVNPPVTTAPHRHPLIHAQG